MEQVNNQTAWVQKLEKLLEISQRLHSTLDVDRALPLVLDSALDLTGMQRGLLMLYDHEQELVFRMGRNCDGDALEAGEFDAGQASIQRTIEQRKLEYFDRTAEIASAGVYSQPNCGLSVPLFSYRRMRGSEETRKMIGVLYLDSRRPVQFGDQEQWITNVLAMHAGLALENATLYELATLDGLTRLYQKHYVEEVARVEWKRSIRHKHSLSVLLLDFDLFKTINDTFGHATGDEVLRRSAYRIRSVCREEDLIGRYGGEEFIFVLPETGQTQASRVADRIHDVIRSSEIRPDRRPVTVSIGCAGYPETPAESIEELIEFADLALYRAKESGRNRTAVYGA